MKPYTYHEASEFLRQELGWSSMHTLRVLKQVRESGSDFQDRDDTRVRYLGELRYGIVRML